MKLILASASPRRRELIKRIEGVSVEIVPSEVEETTEITEPRDHAVALAALKARDVQKRTGGLVLGADTIVAADGKILGKPRGYDEAEEMLRFLCGKTHTVITGLCLTDGATEVLDAETTFVTFGDYDEELMREYIASGSPLDKAGGYGIQDEAIGKLVVGIDGSIDNVIGLPVAKVGKLLMQFER